MLQETIYKAFKGCIHPGNFRLLRQDTTDDSDISFLYTYEGMSWIEIDAKVLITQGACLSALSDLGLNYIIPAYLSEFIKDNYEDPDGWVDRMIAVLASRGRGELTFSRTQIDIINNLFLKEIDNTWKRFGKSGTTYGEDWGLMVRKIRSCYQIGTNRGTATNGTDLRAVPGNWFMIL